MILSKNKNFRKNCQTIWFLVVTFWQTDSWLPGDCQPIVWMVWLMKGIVISDERNCQLRVIQSAGIACASRIQKNRNMGITTLTYWSDVWQQFCPSGASSVPLMRKQRTPVGQASCPFLFKYACLLSGGYVFIFENINKRTIRATCTRRVGGFSFYI